MINAEISSNRMVTGLRSSGKTALLVKMQAWNYIYENADALPLPPPTRRIERHSFDLGHLDTEFIEVPSSLYSMKSPPTSDLISQVDAVIYTIDCSNPIRLQQSQ